MVLVGVWRDWVQGIFIIVLRRGWLVLCFLGVIMGVGRLWRWMGLGSVCRIVRLVEIYVLGKKKVADFWDF
jgi:hypothetical protein